MPNQFYGGVGLLVPATTAAQDCPRADNLVVSTAGLPEGSQVTWEPRDPPCKVSLGCWGLGHVIGCTSTLERHNGLVHAVGASTHLVCPRCVGIMLRAELVACLAIVAIMDMGTVRATVLDVLFGTVGVLWHLLVSSPG